MYIEKDGFKAVSCGFLSNKVIGLVKGNSYGELFRIVLKLICRIGLVRWVRKLCVHFYPSFTKNSGFDSPALFYLQTMFLLYKSLHIAFMPGVCFDIGVARSKQMRFILKRYFKKYKKYFFSATLKWR